MLTFSLTELPPEFIKKLESTRVTAGDTAIFEIELSKGDAMTKWFKNGSDLEQSSRVQLKIDGKKQRLEISDVELGDAGDYAVTIPNSKCNAKLEVEEPKVTFVRKLDETVAGDVGKDVKLLIELSKTNVTVIWHK